MTDHSKTSQDLRTLIASKIAHARDYAEREGFMVSTVCLPPEQADIVIAALAPSPNGTEASRGVGAESDDVRHLDPELWAAFDKAIAEGIAYMMQEDGYEGLTSPSDVSQGIASDCLASVLTRLAATPTPTVSPPDSTGQGEAQSRVPDAEQHFLTIEKRLCAILGRPWAPTGFSIETLLDDVEAVCWPATHSQADAQTQEGGRPCKMCGGDGNSRTSVDGWCLECGGTGKADDV